MMTSRLERLPSAATVEPSDDALWRATRAGSSDAFGELYGRHATAIYNYLFRRLGDWSQAEDLTAIVFLAAYRRRNAVTIEDGKVLAWLYGVATNLLRNQRRALRRHHEVLRQLPRAGSVPDFAPDAAARLDAAAEMRRILKRLRKLPREQQDVVALCLWAELSYEEAAHALSVPIGTVRSRLSRARAALGELPPVDRHEEVDNQHERMDCL